MQESEVEEIINNLENALAAADSGAAALLFFQLHPADQANVLSKLSPEKQNLLLQKLDNESKAEILEELHEDEAAGIISNMSSEALADVLDDMSPEGAADILAELPKDHAASTLAAMEEAGDVQPLLKYPEQSSGGKMSPDFISLKINNTIEDCVNYLRELGPETDTPYYLYVTDEQGKLCGVIGLRDLIVRPPATIVNDVMNSKVIYVNVMSDQEEAARLLSKYNLLLIPVTDDNQVLRGVISSSDVLDIIEQEATEDIYRLSAVSMDGQIRTWSPILQSIEHRLPWLYINLGTAFLAAWVVSLFEATISKVAMLAVFQGIIAGQGGNTGTQTLALMVRGIALGEISFKDSKRAMIRESIIGLLLGIACGAGVGVATWAWKGNALLGIITCVALIGNMVAAGIAGTIIPLGLRALKLDPALASAVLITTVTDCLGFGLFLGLATYFIGYL